MRLLFMYLLIAMTAFIALVAVAGVVTYFLNRSDRWQRALIFLGLMEEDV